jgi:hypothetical protein
LLAIVATAGHTILSVKLGIAYAIPTTIVAVIGGAVAMLGPVGKALARRLEGQAPDAVPGEAVLAELDEVRGRLAELEERVDFSERLLAKAREGGALPGRDPTVG